MTDSPSLPEERLSRALRVLRTGTPVVPVLVGDTKRPALTGWRTRSVEECLAEVEGWWRRWPLAEVGVPTGEVTGLYVVDEDVPGSVGRDVPSSAEWTWVSSRSEGHRHAWFRGGGPCRSSGHNSHPGWDLKGEGGLVVAWNGLPREMERLPDEVRRRWGASRKEDETRPELARNRNLALNRLRIAEVAVAHASEGQRNQALNRHGWYTSAFVAAGSLAVDEWAQRLVAASVASGYPEGEAVDVLSAILRRR